MAWKFIGAIFLALLPLFDGQTTSIIKTTPFGGQTTRFNGNGGGTQPTFQSRPPNGPQSTQAQFPSQPGQPKSTNQAFGSSQAVGGQTTPRNPQSSPQATNSQFSTSFNGGTQPPKVGSSNPAGAGSSTPIIRPGNTAVNTAATSPFPPGLTSPRVGQTANTGQPGQTTPFLRGSTGQNNQPGGQTQQPGGTNQPGGGGTVNPIGRSTFNGATKRVFPTAGIQGVFKPQIGDNSSATSHVGSIIASLLSILFVLVIIR